MSDGKMDAHALAALLKDYNAQMILAQEKVENNIKNIEAIRTEMKEATRELKEAKAIYDSSWKCFIANHCLNWKGALLLIIIFAGLYFIIDGKKGEWTKDENGKISGKFESLQK